MSNTKLQRKVINPYMMGTCAFLICAAAIFAAFGLSVVSWMRICSKACASGHAYRLFGLTFESIGMTGFAALGIMHLFSRRWAVLTVLVGWALYACLGAELIFIYTQKYQIGSWCPVCLSIAALVAIAAGIYFNLEMAIGTSQGMQGFDPQSFTDGGDHSQKVKAPLPVNDCGSKDYAPWSNPIAVSRFNHFFRNFHHSIERNEGGNAMNLLYRGISGVVFFIAGFAIAFAGVGKYDALQAAENDIKDSIAFGQLNSPIEVYVFTDWECISCRHLEPLLNIILPRVMQKARVTFVDDPVHTATLNYTPYNLSFMVYDKSQYFKLRKALGDLAEDTKNPTEQQIQALAVQQGITFQPLNYADIAVATNYFNHLVDKLNVEGTPTVVIVNRDTKKAKKLETSGEITEENINKAIENLKR